MSLCTNVDVFSDKTKIAEAIGILKTNIFLQIKLLLSITTKIVKFFETIIFN